MHRIDTSDNTASLPTLDAVGTAGFFTKGNTGINDATVPGQDWFNMVQEELNHVVEQAALTPDQSKVDWTQLYQAVLILAANEITLDALDYPTISTTDNRITVTPAAATNGGTVAIPADVLISIAKEATAGETGIRQVVKTAAYTSADLAVSSTYYFRAKFIGDAWIVYTQKGTDTDSIPIGLVGIVDGASGGGFDSTVLDVLFAKIETGLAGTVPVITELANADNLDVMASEVISSVNVVGWTNATKIALDWARLPALTGSSMSQVASSDIPSTVDVINTIKTQLSSISRYSIQPQFWTVNTAGQTVVGINSIARA